MASPSAFSGDLALVGLFDVVQLLMLNGATGTLALEQGGAKGYLFLDGGQIINAMDERRAEGEGAAYALFAWKQGRFEFRPEAPGGSRLIHVGTEGLMMEAARRLDEAGAGEATEDGGASARLRHHSGALEALRDAFTNVARDAKHMEGDTGELPDGSPLAQLKSPGDRLVYRAGHAPRLLQSGRWRSISATPFDAAAYDQLRTRLLDGARPLATSGVAGASQTRVITVEGGRELAVTVLAEGAGEALWLRLARLAPPDETRLGEAAAPIAAFVERRAGLLLVAAPTPAGADTLFHAVVAWIGRQRGQSVLLVADDAGWRHVDGAGVLVRAAGDAAREALRALTSDVAAFDVAHAAAAADALHVAPLVVAAVVTGDAASALPRWLSRGDGSALAARTATLTGMPVAVAIAPAARDGRELPVQLVRIAEGAAMPTRSAADAPPATAAGTPPATKGGRAPAKRSPEAVPPPAAPETDPMRALAAELGRQLRKSA